MLTPLTQIHLPVSLYHQSTPYSLSLTYLLLNLPPDATQSLLENFVLGLQAHTSLQVKDSLVEAAQLLQGLAPPVKCFDIPTVLFNG